MAGIYPKTNDREFDLWKKIALNMRQYALANGAPSIIPEIYINETTYTLMRKVAIYTALIP